MSVGAGEGGRKAGREREKGKGRVLEREEVGGGVRRWWLSRVSSDLDINPTMQTLPS